MNSSLKILAIIAVVAINLFTKCSTSSKLIQDIPAETNNSLLWKIEKEGIKNPSYLFGTIHVIPSKDFFFGEKLKQVATHADKIIFEMELNAQITMKAVLSSMIPGNQTLEDLLSPDQYDSLNVFFRDTLGLSELEIMAYEKIKPAFVSQIFITKMLGEAPKSYELEIKKLADSAGIEIIGLETFEEQIGFFDSIPQEIQIGMLMKSIREYTKSSQQLMELIEQYKMQDLDGLYSIMMQDESGFIQIEDLLITGRNKIWVPKLMEIIQETPVFIAVGAGHLPGNEGVIELLRAQGYKLTPLKMD